MRVVFDTNILVDYLAGIVPAQHELNLYSEPLISRITWMEIMAGVEANSDEENAVRAFLARFVLVEIDSAIAECAVLLRREKRLKLPDAIILATARCRQIKLVTRNTRDFGQNSSDIRVPYSWPALAP